MTSSTNAILLALSHFNVAISNIEVFWRGREASSDPGNATICTDKLSLNPAFKQAANSSTVRPPCVRALHPGRCCSPHALPPSDCPPGCDMLQRDRGCEEVRSAFAIRRFPSGLRRQPFPSIRRDEVRGMTAVMEDKDDSSLHIVWTRGWNGRVGSTMCGMQI